MPNPIADLDSYKAGVDADVTTEVAVNSVSPVEVGAIGTDLADLLLPYLQSINNQGHSQGTSVPSNLVGNDLDLYWQQLVSGFSLWRKQNGTWVLKVTMIFVILEDGILSGLRTFIDQSTVTVEPGTWSIDNVRYSKSSQTQFTVPAADANWLRYDLIYADDSGNIGYTNGVASSSPAFPAPATGQLVVDYVVVPSVASGSLPYMLSGGTSSTTHPALVFDETDLVESSPGSSDWYLAFTPPTGFKAYFTNIIFADGSETSNNANFLKAASPSLVVTQGAFTTDASQTINVYLTKE